MNVTDPIRRVSVVSTGQVLDKVGRSGDLVVCRGRLPGPLRLLTGETYIPGSPPGGSAE